MATETPAPAATEPEPVAAEQHVRTEPAPRRTVTLPVLPLVIIGAVIVALIFFGGGVALGVTVGDNAHRVGTVEPFGGQNSHGLNGYGPQGGQHGFGPNRQNGQRGQNGTGQNGTGQQRPTNRPSGAPQNG